MILEKIKSTELSQERFVNEYYDKKPVVIIGEMEKWNISGTTLSTFEKKYGERVVPVRGSNINDFKEFMEVNVSDYIENMKNNPDQWYCDFPTDYEELPEIEKEFIVPTYFTEGTTSYKDGNLYQWVYLGGEGTGTPLHTDVDNSHAWNGLVFGEKEWVVFPIDSEIELYEGKLNLFEKQNSNLLEDYDHAHFYQKSNEIVYIPSGFWHQVKNTKDSLCITGNFWGNNK